MAQREGCKIFNGQNINEVQKQIDAWLAEKGTKIAITRALQSESLANLIPSYTITIFFRKDDS